MAKLDEIDRKLLRALDRDSRQPFSAIAKSLDIPQETVRYRFNRLVEQKVLQSFPTIVDLWKLGYSFYKVFLKLHSVNEAKIAQIVSYLKTNEHIPWVVRLDGNYDLAFSVKVTDTAQLSGVIDAFMKEFHECVSKRIFSINVMLDYLPRDYLTENSPRNVAKLPHSAFGGKQQTVDTVNHHILTLLSEDSRISASDIAKRLGSPKRLGKSITREAVLQRIKRLEKEEIIERYTVVLNHEALDQTHYKVLMYFNQVSPEYLAEFKDYCRANSAVTVMVKSIGEWDYELDLEVANFRKCRSFLMDINERFASLIKDYQTLVITNVHKYSIYPAPIIED